MAFLKGLFGKQQGSGVRCFTCKRAINEPAGGPAGALFNPSLSLSGSVAYPCKSCGTVFCLDCMARLKQRGTCPRCGGAIGW